MILAVYRSKETDKIQRVHEVKIKGVEKTAKAERNYNTRNDVKDYVRCVEFSDDSLENFLYRMKAGTKEDYKNELYDISDTLDDISNRLDSFIREMVE